MVGMALVLAFRLAYCLGALAAIEHLRFCVTVFWGPVLGSPAVAWSAVCLHGLCVHFRTCLSFYFAQRLWHLQLYRYFVLFFPSLFSL